MKNENTENIEISELSNGIQIVTEHLPHLRSLAFSIWLKKGSRHEPSELNGISHFIEHLIFKGTKNLRARDISLLVDEMGGNVNAFTTREEVSFYMKMLDTEIDRGVKLLADIVQGPAFRNDDIELERQVILEEIRMTEDSPDESVADNFFLNFWEDQAIGRPVQGTTEIVQAISGKKITDYYAGMLRPSNVVIAAAGSLNHSVVVEKMERFFGNICNTSDSPVADAPVNKPFVFNYVKSQLEQVRFMMGREGVPITDDDRYPVMLLGTLLGGNSSSRLFQKIREEKGLVYDIVAASFAFQDTGVFFITGGAQSRSIPEVLKIIRFELMDLLKNPPQEEELNRLKNFVKGNMVLSLEGSNSRMSRLARQLISFGRTFTLDEMIEKIDGVTSDDIARSAARLLIGKWSISMVRPAGDFVLDEDLLTIDA